MSGGRSDGLTKTTGRFGSPVQARGMDRATGDYVGMLVIVMNAVTQGACRR